MRPRTAAGERTGGERTGDETAGNQTTGNETTGNETAGNETTTVAPPAAPTGPAPPDDDPAGIEFGFEPG